MSREKEITEISMYMAKIYSVTEPENANRIIEDAKKESKTTGLSYKEILSNEFIKLLEDDKTEKDNTKVELNEIKKQITSQLNININLDETLNRTATQLKQEYENKYLGRWIL